MKIEVGKRIRVSKSDSTQQQWIGIGERGTIKDVRYDGWRAILTIDFDFGERMIMDSTEFRFDVYDKV